jgi:hypothetical protein
MAGRQRTQGQWYELTTPSRYALPPGTNLKLLNRLSWSSALCWVMIVPGTCGSSGRSALNIIQGAVNLCGSQTSCDHLLDTEGPKALYPRYLTVRVCRLLNMTFGEFTFFQALR